MRSRSAAFHPHRSPRRPRTTSTTTALIVALVAGGGPAAPAATAVVPAHRIITVWLPLPPGAPTLGALVRLKVV
ncbi:MULTISPECIES: hypothetical protein [Streptomyces]|uniref:hypothetical protein n=1 Tax=Streptomyces TaxID=1883 RepID=UPI0033B49D97